MKCDARGHSKHIKIPTPKYRFSINLNYICWSSNLEVASLGSTQQRQYIGPLHFLKLLLLWTVGRSKLMFN